MYKKLKEANFFFAKMRERAAMAFGNHEEFDFYLSAFLSAARSVTFRLENERSDEYKKFRDSYFKKLSPDDDEIFKFMNEERVHEIHKKGSMRDCRDEPIPVYDSYQDKSGSVKIFTTPGLSEGPPATISKPEYFYEINGIKRSVISVCKQYLGLLDSLIKNFCKSMGKP